MGSDRLSSCNYKLYAGYFKFQHAIEMVLGELAGYLLWQEPGPALESCTPLGTQICPFGLPSGLRGVGLHPLEQAPCIPQNPAAPGKALACCLGLSSLYLAHTYCWMSRLDGFGNPTPHLALTPTLLPPGSSWPLPAGRGWEFLGPVGACNTCRVVLPDFLTFAAPF